MRGKRGPSKRCGEGVGNGGVGVAVEVGVADGVVGVGVVIGELVPQWGDLSVPD